MGASFEVKKVLGTMNPAGKLMKYLGPGEVGKGVGMLGMEYRDGRAKSSVKVAEGWKE